MSGDHRSADWKAVVLDEDIDREQLTELRSTPTITVTDELLSQLQAELETIVPAAGADLRREPPRWVYYPWRRQLVAMLGPRSYRALRLDRNRNKITEAVQEKLGKMRIGVVGQSVGHIIAHTLALEGICGELRLADHDGLELANLNRIPASVFDIGISKAVVTARRIAELDPYIDIDVFAAGIDQRNITQFVDGLDLIVEECDSLDVKVLIREIARERRIPVVMATSDRGLFDVERFDLEPGRPLFHGMLGDVRAEQLRGLRTQDKVPYVLQILEPGELSASTAASMIEVDRLVTSWPQLAEDVVMGAASVAAAVRRIGSGDPQDSIRVRIDLDTVLAGIDDTTASPPPQISVETRALAELPGEPIRGILHAASLAPSGGNSQPWQFEVGGECIDFHLAPERTSTMDIAFRGSYLGIGAALTNARIAAAAAGVLGPTALFPDGEAGPVARLHLGTGSAADLASMRTAMLARCSNRNRGNGRRIDTALLAELGTALDPDNGRLHLFTERPLIDECALLLARLDRLRYLTPTLHAEMMSELRWPGVDTLDVGLDVRTLELSDADLAKLEVVRRPDVMSALSGWGGGHALGDLTRDAIRSCGAVAVLTTPGRDPVDYVRAGQNVESFWIRAQAAGLAVQVMSPVSLYAQGPADHALLVDVPYRAELTQLAEQFRSLSAVADDEELALVLRLSYAPESTARSERMSLAALIRPSSPTAAGSAVNG